MKKVLSKLAKAISNRESNEEIKIYEGIVVESIEEAAKESDFYTLPIDEISKLVEKSDIESYELLSEIVLKTSEIKEKESPLLLNVINRVEELSLDECVKIIKNFIKCPLCVKIGELFEYENNLPERDYEHEILDLKKEIEKQKLKPKPAFPPITEIPSDFVNDICKAAQEGKLTSVQWLIEQCHADVETKDNNGYTPINFASRNGHLEVVKYLRKQCHADVETNNWY